MSLCRVNSWKWVCHLSQPESMANYAPLTPGHRWLWHLWDLNRQSPDDRVTCYWSLSFILFGLPFIFLDHLTPSFPQADSSGWSLWSAVQSHLTTSTNFHNAPQGALRKTGWWSCTEKREFSQQRNLNAIFRAKKKKKKRWTAAT